MLSVMCMPYAFHMWSSSMEHTTCNMLRFCNYTYLLGLWSSDIKLSWYLKDVGFTLSSFRVTGSELQDKTRSLKTYKYAFSSIWNILLALMNYSQYDRLIQSHPEIRFIRDVLSPLTQPKGKEYCSKCQIITCLVFFESVVWNPPQNWGLATETGANWVMELDSVEGWDITGFHLSWFSGNSRSSQRLSGGMIPLALAATVAPERWGGEEHGSLISFLPC